MTTPAPLHRRPWLILGLGLALLLGLWAQLKAPTPVVRGSAAIGAPFTLVDQRGAPRSDKDLLGHYSLIYFGYSFCPDVCPTDLAALSAGLAAFEAQDAARGKQVQPIFITIDPARDTVPALKDYAANFHPRLMALTGSAAQSAAALKAYHVYAQKNINADDPKNYLMDHTALFYLIGPDGHYVAHLPGASAPTAITAWLRQFVS
jgi:protein SCO1